MTLNDFLNVLDNKTLITIKTTKQLFNGSKYFDTDDFEKVKKKYGNYGIKKIESDSAGIIDNILIKIKKD